MLYVIHMLFGIRSKINLNADQELRNSGCHPFRTVVHRTQQALHFTPNGTLSSGVRFIEGKCLVESGLRH